MNTKNKANYKLWVKWSLRRQPTGLLQEVHDTTSILLSERTCSGMRLWLVEWYTSLVAVLSSQPVTGMLSKHFWGNNDNCRKWWRLYPNNRLELGGRYILGKMQIYYLTIGLHNLPIWRTQLSSFTSLFFPRAHNHWLFLKAFWQLAREVSLSKAAHIWIILATLFTSHYSSHGCFLKRSYKVGVFWFPFIYWILLNLF